MLVKILTFTPPSNVRVVVQAKHTVALTAQAYLPKEMHVAVFFDSVHGSSFGCERTGEGLLSEENITVRPTLLL